MINFIEMFFGLSRVVGILLLGYGTLLAVVPDHQILNLVGLISYYAGAYQIFLTEPSEDETST
jgi:cadmium resistance protein CadD (predicted permease)